MQISYNQLKKMSKDLLSSFKEDSTKVSHSQILESFSHTLGFRDFNALSAKLKSIEVAKNTQQISYEKWLCIVERNQMYIKTFGEYSHDYSEDLKEDDKKRYLEPLEMNLYDFCTLYFKRTQQSRRYNPTSSYFNLNHFSGNVCISLNSKKIETRKNPLDFISYLNKEPVFIVFDEEEKIKNDHSFNVTFFIDGKNIVLRYLCVEDFVMDFLDFTKNSDFFHCMHPENFKNLMLRYSAIFTRSDLQDLWTTTT